MQRFVFGPVVFRERSIIAAVTSPLISMGRLLKDGWHLENSADGTMSLARKHRRVPVHFTSRILRVLQELIVC